MLACLHLTANVRCHMQGAQRTHCTLRQELSHLCRKKESGRLQPERALDSESVANGRTTNPSRFAEHISGCLHPDPTRHRLPTGVPQTIPYKDRDHPLEATRDHSDFGPGSSPGSLDPSVDGAAHGKCRNFAGCPAVHLRHAECPNVSAAELCASL